MSCHAVRMGGSFCGRRRSRHASRGRRQGECEERTAASLAFARVPSVKAKNKYNGHIGDQTYYLACVQRARIYCTNRDLQSCRKYIVQQ